MDFGSHLGSIFSHFPSFWHHFFEHRFYIAFSSILGWIFHRFFIIFGCKISSVTEPREPSKLEQVSNESSVLLSQGTSIFHDFPKIFFIIFTRFSIFVRKFKFPSKISAFCIKHRITPSNQDARMFKRNSMRA